MKAVALMVFAVMSVGSVYAGEAQKAAPKPAAGKDAYVTMSLSDLKLDIKHLKGKKVSVEAEIQSMGDLQMLKDGPMDMTGIFADTSRLPREDRKKLVDGCQFALCSGVFSGTVKPLPLGLGLAVDLVEWD